MQVRQSDKDPSRKALKHRVIAKVYQAHGVHDVNTVVWCPRKGFEDLFAFLDTTFVVTGPTQDLYLDSRDTISAISYSYFNDEGITMMTDAFDLTA